jgi:membrane protein YqaA with SNARE-associated domain
MDLINLGLLGLFSGTFLAGSIIPFPSEALVIGSYEMGYGFWTVLIVATLGNLLGGLTNYWIGYKSNSAGLKKRFKLNEEKISRWEKRMGKWGIWLGLLSWVPFVGDPMVGVLGFFKVRLLPLSIMMLIGKFGRYFLLLYAYAGIVGIYGK